MSTLYKLTDKDGYTRRGQSGETLWAAGITHTATGAGNDLCSNSVIHAYRSALLAVLLNPAHANIQDPILWKSEGDIVVDGGAKIGTKSLTTLTKIEIPAVTMEQRVRFGILCAKKVYTGQKWVAWANKWLSEEDRGLEAAEAAAVEAAKGVAVAAALAAEVAEEEARWAEVAEVAAAAARAAQRAAMAAMAAKCDERFGVATLMVAVAAMASVEAAKWQRKFDLTEIAELAMLPAGQ